MESFLFVKSGNKVAWVWLWSFLLFRHLNLKLNLLFQESKEDSATSTVGHTLQRRWKSWFLNGCLTMIHFHYAFGGLQNFKNYQKGKKLPNDCLRSAQGCALGPKLHCDHYFNTLCTTAPPTPSPSNAFWSCQILIHFPNDIAAKMQLDPIWGPWLIA